MFVGRKEELEEIRRAIASERAELGIVYGRRRIGKSSLLEHAGKHAGTLCFEGLEAGIARKQIDHFADQLARQTKTVRVRASTWKDAFDALTPHLRRGRRYVVFDELPWMASGRTELVALLKFYWDRHWKANPRLTLVLCGSIANFMVNHVVHSSALHNRKTFEIKVDPLNARDAAAFFRGLRSDFEIAKFLMVFGGVPKYLEQLDPSAALAANMDRLCFSRNGFFVNEFESIFKEQFKVTKTYEAIALLLASGARSKEHVASSLGQVGGGGLGTYLEHLEQADFVRAFSPLAIDHARGAKTKRHVLWDEWLRFYFTYMRPNLASIRAHRGRGLFNSLTAASIESYFGLAFERLCMRNLDGILAALNVAHHELMGWGPFFRQPPRGARKRAPEEGLQIDLLLRRRGDVLTLIECKFHSDPVGMGVIAEVERKIRLLRAPRRFTIERVLIAANGVTPQVEQRRFFHRILDLGCLFR